MKFDPDILAAALSRLPPCQGVLVGLSGGLDSVVLLHALVQLRHQSRLPGVVRAVHVNHGLHPDCAHWEQECRVRCADWEVEFLAMKVDVPGVVDPETASGLENAAREARYGAFRATLRPEEVLLLAHHRDDQMETLLLRLMRGAGPRGLAGIPQARELGSSSLFRPLLDVDRTALAAYAQQEGLTWIEDSANKALRFDRNFVRHEMLPRLESRWPGYRESWSKSIVLATEAEALLLELAQADLCAAQGKDRTLRVEVLQSLSEPRQRNALRHWFATLHLPEPGWDLLHAISNELLAVTAPMNASKEANGVVITRYRDRLTATLPFPPVDCATSIDWDPVTKMTCELPLNGLLLARACTDSDADRRLAIALDGPVQIRYRQGGEVCQMQSRPRRPLKKILQEAGIEPWLRERLPLLYRHQDLLYIPGIGATTSAPAAATGKAVVIEWRRPGLAAGGE